MPLSIQNQLTQIGLNQTQGTSTERAKKAMQSLSSGVRAQRAEEGALDLDISDRLRNQQLDLNTAQQNAFDAVAIIQTADSAFDQVGQLTRDMFELANKAAAPGLTEEERAKLQGQYEALSGHIQDLSQKTQYRGMNLLDGSASGVSLRIGTTSAPEGSVQLDIPDPTTLGYQDISLVSPEATAGAQETLGSTLDHLDQIRSYLGESEQRVYGALSYLQVAAENTAAATSGILDADTALQESRLVTGHILSQSPRAIQAQAHLEQRTVEFLLKS